jgi:hypothetical protein
LKTGTKSTHKNKKNRHLPEFKRRMMKSARNNQPEQFANRQEMTGRSASTKNFAEEDFALFYTFRRVGF